MMEKARQGGGGEGAEDVDEDEDVEEVEVEEWDLEVVITMDLMVGGPLGVDVAEDVEEALELEVVAGAMVGELIMCKMLVVMRILV